jgi:hypothetical protein
LMRVPTCGKEPSREREKEPWQSIPQTFLLPIT